MHAQPLDQVLSALQATQGIAAKCLGLAEQGDRLPSHRCGQGAAVMLHDVGDGAAAGGVRRAGHFNVQGDKQAKAFAGRWRRRWRNFRVRFVFDADGQRVEVDFEDRGQVACGTVQHRLARFGALDRGDRDRQLLGEA